MNEDTKKEITKAYSDGMTPEDLGKAFGLKINEVLEVIKNNHDEKSKALNYLLDERCRLLKLVCENAINDYLMATKPSKRQRAYSAWNKANKDLIRSLSFNIK